MRRPPLVPCEHVLRGLRHSVYPNQVPIIWWGHVHLAARVVCGRKHHARDSRHAGVLGRCGSVFVSALVFVVYADAGAHAPCLLGSAWCLEYHCFFIDLHQSCFTYPRAVAAPATLAAPPPIFDVCTHVRTHIRTRTGSSDQSLIVEILGLEDTVADQDCPKFYWDDLVQMNEAAQAPCVAASMHACVHPCTTTHACMRVAECTYGVGASTRGTSTRGTSSHLPRSLPYTLC